MTISAVGSLFSATGSGLTTLNVSPTAVGDCLVLAVTINFAADSVTSVSGGGVASWTLIAGPYTVSTNPPSYQELWLGTVTATGPATITVAHSLSVTTTLDAQQFHNTAGGAWGLDGSQAGVQGNTISSTTVTYPTLTPSAGGELYVGHAFCPSSSSYSGVTSGFTSHTDAGGDPFIYGVVSATASPSETQNVSGLSYAIAALITGSAVTPAAPPKQIPSTPRRGGRQRLTARLGAAGLASAGIFPAAAVITGPVIGVTTTAVAGTATGGVTVVQQVAGTSQNDYGLSTVSLSTTTGNALVLLAGWDLSATATSGAMPAAYVVDSAGNYWHHVTTSTSSVAGSRCTAWVCTNAMAISWLSVSLTSFATSLAWTVIELANMPAYFSLDAADANADPSAASLTAGPGYTSTAGMSFALLAAGASGLNVSTPAGWNALTGVTSGAAGSAPVQIFPAWAPVAAGTLLNTTWSLPRSVPVSALAFSIVAAPPAPVQPNPDFPIIKVEAGFGFTPGDPSQPPPDWTDITPRVMAPAGGNWVTSTMGREYELSTPEAGELTIGLNNLDGAFLPGNTASPYYPDVVLGTPIHISAFWQGRWYHAGFGYAERWPQEWPDLPQWGISNLVATDAISVMASATMTSALDGDMLLDGPYVMIPCSEQYTTFTNGINPTFTSADAQGLLAANISRVNQRAAMYVDGLAAAASTGQSTQMLGDPDAGFGTSSITTAPTAPTSGPGVIYTDPNLPGPLSPSGVSVEIWLLIPSTVASTSLQPVVFSAFGPPSNYQTARPSLQVQVLNFTGSNTLKVTLADGSSVSATFNTSANPQQAVLTLTSASLSVYVNGVLATSASLSASQTTAWYAWAGGCPNYAYGCGSLTAGNFTVFDLAVYPCILPTQRIVSHYSTGALGQENVDATARLAQIMAWANLGIPRAGQVTFGGASAGIAEGPAYDLSGKNVADAASQLAANESGMLTVAPSGAVVFWHRYALFNQSPVAVFGDDPSPGTSEVPYLQAGSWSYDNTYLYNRTQTTQQVGPNTTITVAASDFGSEASYFARSAFQTTIQTTSDLDAYTQANWAKAKYSQPALRVKGITVSGASHTDAFATILTVQQGQVATVIRRPAGGAVVDQTVLIERIGHSIGPGKWDTDFQLSPFTPEDAVLQLDAPGFSVLGNVTLA